jgi:DNA-binding response OmpR family regulator
VPKVLVVDDHTDSNDSLTELLQIEGFEVAQARCGGDATRLAAQHVPDVVVLDLAMPDKTGIEVAKELRRVATLNQTKIIAYTGFSQANIRERALEAGCDKFLLKPIDPVAFVDCLKRVCAPSHPKVLFVDDDETKRYACCSILRNDGMVVYESFNGEHAMSVLDRQKPQLVVSDAMLGDTSGYDLCTRIKKAINVPVLLVSCRPMDKELARISRIDGYIDDFGNEKEFLRQIHKQLRAS